MRYYKVLVSSPRYHKSDPLTYAYKSTLTTGTLVIVSLQNRDVLGIVVEDTAKPSFKTKEIIRTVIDTPVPKTTIELMNWLSDFYPAPSGYITSQFMPSGLLQAPRAKKNLPQNSTNSSLPVLPTLSPQQRGVLKQIADLPNQQTFLLHGDTGTGKTRLYIELAVLAQNNNKDALVMTPEISLTPQLVREFEHAFMRSVIIMHSNLTPAERRDAWLKVLYATEPVIVIGPRSALFAPFRNLGLIIVDEAHEQAYKQEQAPYYDARRVASKLAALHKARLIFGSATPNITDYYMAEAKNAPILRMTKLATNDTHANAAIELIQMRDKSEFSRHPYLSDKLLNAIQDSLNKHEQSLIFLNRRGTARLVLCQVCGWQAMCPNCDLPLTYHGDSHHLRCHTCGFKDKAPSRCPECGSADIIYKSLGTKSLVSALEKFFPNVRMQRFDTDNLKSERLDSLQSPL